MKSLKQYRIVHSGFFFGKPEYTVEELYVNRNGRRSEWRTWKYSIHEALFPLSFRKVEDAEEAIREKIQADGHTPRVVKEIGVV